ncbi:unnamed protein product [Urochloa humidicola]
MPNSTVTSASAAVSNHCQLLLTAASTMPRPSVFRFNNHWTRLPGCADIVHSAWNNVHNRTGTAKLVLGLKRCRADLKAWQCQLPRPKDQLHNCQLVITMMDLLEEQRHLFPAEAMLQSLVKEVSLELSSQLALYWQQRGKIKACVLGDENTKLHLLSASVQWRHNRIKVLRSGDGNMVTDHQFKATLLHAFYRDLLGSSTPCQLLPNLLTLFEGSRLTSGQAAALVQPFTLQELKHIVFSMRKDCAPGLDGSSPMFFQANWDTLKADLLQLLNDFHSGHAELERINKAFLVLLPKKTAALLLKDYRPISLQNCATKFCTKGMTLRLQPWIPFVVHSDQTGFIKTRCIAENFLYAAEIVQCCHKRHAPTIVLKLDFTKAFDSVSWDAMDAILEAKGFPAE